MNTHASLDSENKVITTNVQAHQPGPHAVTTDKEIFYANGNEEITGRNGTIEMKRARTNATIEDNDLTTADTTEMTIRMHQVFYLAQATDRHQQQSPWQ